MTHTRSRIYRPRSTTIFCHRSWSNSGQLYLSRSRPLESAGQTECIHRLVRRPISDRWSWKTRPARFGIPFRRRNLAVVFITFWADHLCQAEVLLEKKDSIDTIAGSKTRSSLGNEEGNNINFSGGERKDVLEHLL